MRAAGRERCAEQTANRLGAILGSRGCGERKPDASPSLRRAGIERRDLVRLGGYEVVTEARVKYSTALSVAVRATQGRSASRTSDASVAIRRSMSAFVMTAPTMPACRQKSFRESWKMPDRVALDGALYKRQTKLDGHGL